MKKDCCVEAVEAVETPRDMPSRARLTPRDAMQENKFCIVNFPKRLHTDAEDHDLRARSSGASEFRNT